MLAKRIIPCLDVKDGMTVKGTNFVNLRQAGDPVELGRTYSEQGADELVFLDITASHEGRKTFADMVQRVAATLSIPFTVGGGINELKDVDRLEERFIDHPALAIEQIRIAISTMANISRNCLFDAVSLIDDYSDTAYKKILELEHASDIYEDKLTSYIVKVSKNQLNKEQSQILGMYLRSITDLERIGDHSKNIAQSAKSKTLF